IENVSGANGNIAVGRAARARPDGYTIDLGTIATHVMNGAFYSLPYDVLGDFAPISQLYATAFILMARKTMLAKDLRELIGWLKANPNKVSVGISTTSGHAIAASFQKETATQFTLVPYRGVAGMQDLVAGQIDLFFNALDQLPLVR